MKEEIKQPEALQLKYMYDSGDPYAHGNMWKVSVCNELERLHAECEKLKAELVAEAARTASEKLRADQMSQQHSTQAALNKEAREELASLRKDAERYRWLRLNNFCMHPGHRDGPSHPKLVGLSFDIWHEKPETHNREGLDAVIDKARGAA